MYSYGLPHMAVQKQDDQHEHTFSSYVRIRDVDLKTCLGRWTIGRSGERGSGISVLPARYDDDDMNDIKNSEQIQIIGTSTQLAGTIEYTVWYMFGFMVYQLLLVINTKPRFNIHIIYIWFVNTFCIYTVKWSNSSISNDPIFLKSTKLNCSTYCYLSLTLQSNTSYLFTNS